MKRFLITSTALSMIVTSVPLPVMAQQTVRVGDREVICLRSEDEPCPDGASCVVAKRAANCERNANRAFGGEAAAPEGEPALDEPLLTEEPVEEPAEALAEPEAEVFDDAPTGDLVIPEAAADPVLIEEAPLIEPDFAVEPEIAVEPDAGPAPDMLADEPIETAPEIALDNAPIEEDPALVEDLTVDDVPVEALEEEVRPVEDLPVLTEEAPVLAEEAPAILDEAPAGDEAPLEVAPEIAVDAPEEPATDEPQETFADEGPLTDEQLLEAIDTAEGVDAPSAEAVGALSDILAEDDGMADAPVAAASAEPAEDPTDTGTTDTGTIDSGTIDSGTTDEALIDEAPAETPSEREIPREEVIEVTEGDTRSSDEDFDGEVLATERARDGEGRDRLSNLEKFGLVALGALVVGSVLRNGNQVVSNTGDRVVVQQPDGTYVVLKDDDALIRQPGSTVRTETFSDGSTRSTVINADGGRVVTIRDAAGRVLKRSRIDASGREVLLIDDLTPVERIDVSLLPEPRQAAVISTSNTDAGLRAALLAEESRAIGRSFSLRQIRDYREVRALAPSIDVESITFPSGSAAIRATEAQKLAQLGRLMASMVEENPAELFLIEGHTDAVGAGSYNLALSDRRAESVALALTEYYGVPPENMVVQGYGERELLVETSGDEAANRRAAVRIISPLLQRVASN